MRSLAIECVLLLHRKKEVFMGVSVALIIVHDAAVARKRCHNIDHKFNLYDMFVCTCASVYVRVYA